MKVKQEKSSAVPPDETTDESKVMPRGFATTPLVLRYGGPQMEDYGDWDSWYAARQMWVLEERMRGNKVDHNQ